MSDDVDDLRKQWLAELEHERENADETALVQEWKAAAEKLRPARRRRGNGSVPGTKMTRATFVQAVQEHCGDIPVPADALDKAAENWQHMCHGNIAVARDWWAAGMNPFDDRAWDLVLAGVRPADLRLVWGGETLLQHFLAGVEAHQCAVWALFLRRSSSQESA